MHIFVSVGGKDVSLQFEQISLGDDANGGYNLASAHFCYDFTGALERLASEELRTYNGVLQALGRHGRMSTSISRLFPELTDVVREMLTAETSLAPMKSQIHPSFYKTRDSIVLLLEQILSQKRDKIALPLPNWHFWNMADTQDRFAYFDAKSDRELAENFEMIARKDKKIGALILVNPANPLGYTLSATTCRALDAVAQRYGIAVVIDDVLRGVQPVSGRNSVARHFTEPYVVEGFSKRFGDHSALEEISYTITPKGSKYKPYDDVEVDDRKLAGALLSMGLAHVTDQAVAELTARNKAFANAFTEHSGGIKLSFPSKSHLTATFALPEHVRNPELWATELQYEGASVSLMKDFYPEGYPVSAVLRDLVRITCGRLTIEQNKSAGRFIGDHIRTYGR